MSFTSPLFFSFFYIVSLPLRDFAEHSKGVRATKEQLSSQERERGRWMDEWMDRSSVLWRLVFKLAGTWLRPSVMIGLPLCLLGQLS